MNGLRAEIERFAPPHGLDPDMVQAVIRIESSENRWAFNPEPRYRYLWDNRLRAPFRKLTAIETASKFPPDDFTDIRGFRGESADHEWWGQQTSWGLMQVMGAVARELGFREVFLSQLIETGYNLEYGCAMLGALRRWAEGDPEAMLAAYNGGKSGNRPGDIPKRNQNYALKCLSETARIKSRPIPI